MSARSRRSVQFTSSTSSGASSSFNASDATSPARISRQEEKEALSHLNDRLSAYIDRVRTLEVENQRLSYQIRASEETITKERDGIRGAFEAELADARRLLDETARDRARVQIEAGKYKAQLDELNGRIAKLERELKDSEGRRVYAEQLAQDEKAKAANADNARKVAEDEARRARAEVADLQKQLASAHKQLEDETLGRVDMENRIQSLREELAFNKQLYEKEISETRRKRQTEVTEINTQLEDDYQQKLQDGLSDMRAQFDSQLRANRMEIEDLYERKLEAARAQSAKDSDLAIGARDELKRLRIALETSEKDRGKFETELGALTKKIRDLEATLNSERDNFYARLASREEEIRRLQQELSDAMKEYADLMDVKIKLDVEIEAYRRLLESEESRLNLSSESRSGSKAVRAGAKRKRVMRDERDDLQMSYSTRSEGDSVSGIEIAEHDQENGLFIRLVNNGDQDVQIGGYLLRCNAGDREVTHKFHRAAAMKAGSTVTVWSSDAQVTHSPPSDIVMRKSAWPTGDKMRTILVSTDGSDEVEVCSRETSKNTSSGGGSARYSYRSAGTRGGDYSPAAIGDDQKCSIM